MLTTLNIIIGLIFVLLLFSLLASTVMEVIASILSLRSKHLRYTLENMLMEKADDFIKHPFFKQLSYASSRKARLNHYYMPSYVRKDAFTAIVNDLLHANTKEELASKIDELEGDLRRIMQFFFRKSDGDPIAFTEELENWFDAVMERATDWYRRNLKWWLFGVGIALAAIFNVDTIQIYQNISSNTTTQTFLVDMAKNFEANTDTISNPNLNLNLDEALTRLDSSLQKIEQLRSPLGLGWSPAQTEERNIPWWLIKIAGLLITGIAVTFGAPFWFDLLKKLLRIRTNESSSTSKGTGSKRSDTNGQNSTEPKRALPPPSGNQPVG